MSGDGSQIDDQRRACVWPSQCAGAPRNQGRAGAVNALDFDGDVAAALAEVQSLLFNFAKLVKHAADQRPAWMFMATFGQVGGEPASDETAVVASKIRSVDRELDVLERERMESIVRGMRAPNGAAAVVRMGQDSSDIQHARLMQERAELVEQLKALLGDS